MRLSTAKEVDAEHLKKKQVLQRLLRAALIYVSCSSFSVHYRLSAIQLRPIMKQNCKALVQAFMPVRVPFCLHCFSSLWAAAPRRPSFRPFYPLGSERRNKMFNRKSIYIQMPFLRCKMLVGIVPNPLCTASAGCRLRICAKCFYNKKEHRGLPPKQEESSVFSAYRVCAFSLVVFSSAKKISTFFCAFISSCISSRALRQAG